MSEILIFGGTTEGRKLADFCSENGISATVSVTTGYGAELLNDSVSVLSGKMDMSDISKLISGKRYDFVIDATHPYAREATRNISLACKAENVPYLRLIRSPSEVCGETAESISDIVESLNKSDEVILSTLGSKSLPELMKIKNYRERLYVRVLPSEEYHAADKLPEGHIIAAKPPFSTEQNIADIRRTGAKILLTKDSGKIGGYPEKIKAAEICGIRTMTLLRPKESGFAFEEITEFLRKECL